MNKLKKMLLITLVIVLNLSFSSFVIAGDEDDPEPRGLDSIYYTHINN